MKNSVFFVALLTSLFSFSQTLKGVVLDAKTNAPIESASIYYDNTTIGTSTNSKGEFEIEYDQDLQSSLIISFLGYQKLTIPNYSPKQFYKVLLDEQNDMLDEVVIYADDGMSRELKLKFFRSQFLGKSVNGRSCKILNEDDLTLRYNKNTKQLMASSKVPLIIMNENLKYKIQFEMKDFILGFGNVNLETEHFHLESLIYTGTSFFESLDNDSTIVNKRNKVYKGSVLHFMRTLAKQQLAQEDYQIFSKGFKVDPERYISVKSIKNSDAVEVKLRLPLSVMYNNKYQSELLNRQLTSEENPSNSSYFNTTITINRFGNYSPIEAMYFSGYMSLMRLGDTLPLDYELSNTNN